MSTDDDGDARGDGWATSEEGISFYFVVFLTLLALVLVLSKMMQDRPKLSSVLPEAGMVIMVGIVAGFFVSLVAPSLGNGDAADGAGDDDVAVVADNVADNLLSFSSTVFFVALLPPIIFNSGYHLKRDMFFRHLKPISLFACVGTSISTCVVAVVLELVTRAGLVGDFRPTFTELLTFGALISATDPVSTLAVFQAKRVDPHLFYLTFGESVLNDAVGLVLFTTLSKLVSSNNDFETVTVAIISFFLDFTLSATGALCLGVLSGVVAALLLKTVDLRSNVLLELSFYVLVMYFPFFLAEILGLSGIVTILFTGIAAKRYAVPNLSPSTESEADALFRVTAHLAETAIFLELGLSVFGLASHGNFHGKFILFAIFACLFGRALNVYPIALVFNKSLREARSDAGGRRRVPAETEMGTHREPLTSGENAIGNDNEAAKQKSDDYSVATTMTVETQTPPSRRDLRIAIKSQHMLFFSGLRGAVAYACAKNFPDNFGHRTPFIICTMVIVLITVFLLGGTTELALNVLNIDVDVDETTYMENQGTQIRSNFIHNFEKKYLFPCVVRDYNKPELETTTNFQNDADGAAGTDGQPSSRISYVSQIEMTEAAHMENMRQTGHPNESERPKKSLYDYGFR